MWPQGYGIGVSRKDQKASREKNEGDLYRAYEIEYIISKTINNPEYADQKNWIMLGDFNSRSRLDNAHYNYPENDARFLCQDKIAEMTDLKDAVYLKNDGKFCPTTYNGSRIDYVYLSEPLFERTVNARVVNDDWTKPVTSYYEHYFKVPSDHLPILIDIQL